VDCGGGDADRPFKRASAFHALGYRTAIVRDDDNKPTEGVDGPFVADGGRVIAWRDGRALEDELFLSLTDDAIGNLIDRAIELHGDELINEHIKSASQNNRTLAVIRAEAVNGGITPESRKILGKAARTKKAGWFKSVTWMEDVARDIVGPDIENADEGFRTIVYEIFEWADNAGG
jgi:putative ATP-dependent endonuclease of the OLD family